jgi:hypothetical protein
MPVARPSLDRATDDDYFMINVRLELDQSDRLERSSFSADGVSDKKRKLEERVGKRANKYQGFVLIASGSRETGPSVEILRCYITGRQKIAD